MKIVVTGLVATYPLGGVAWDYLAYVEGFRRLGHEVFYLEDTGGWFYDPVAQTFTDRIQRNLDFLTEGLRRVGAARTRWAVRAPDGTYHGSARDEVLATCRTADLLLNVSGACWLREEYRGARCHAYLDSDPGYSQAKLWAADHGQATEDERYSVNLIRAHDRFFTFAENMGGADCRIPACGLRWQPTRQPLVLDHWPYSFRPESRAFTTVMSWKTDVTLPLIDGVRYGGKDVEFLRFLDLPAHTDATLEVAVAGSAPLSTLRARGWKVVDARTKSATMADYRSYLQQSRGEWSVAKNAYVGLRSGWFSTRSAAYLALGKPVAVQDTAWSRYYESGAGLLAFASLDEAAGALEAIDADYRRHCDAARAFAEREFRAETVLERLLRDAGF
jgi:hypothetical protein